MSRMTVEIPFAVDRGDDVVELRVTGTVSLDDVRVDALHTLDGAPWAGALTEGEWDKVEDRLFDRFTQLRRGDVPEPHDLDADWNR